MRRGANCSHIISCPICRGFFQIIVPFYLIQETHIGSSSSSWYFKFEAAWLLEPSCEAEVRRLWDGLLRSVLDRLKTVSEGLLVWARKLKRGKKMTGLDL